VLLGIGRGRPLALSDEERADALGRDMIDLAWHIVDSQEGRQ
jgi:hypothetical protein